MTPARLLAVVMLTALAVIANLPASPNTIQAQEPTETTDRCDGAEEWLDTTWERHMQSSQAIQRFIIELQGGEPFDPEVFSSVANDLKTFVQVQSASNPPPAAEALHDMLIENRALYAEAMELFAQYVESGDEEAGNRGADRVAEARLVGERTIAVIDAFKVECDVTGSAAFRIPACYGQETTAWLNLTSVRLTKFLDAADAAADRLELGLPVDEQLAQMEELRNEQVRSTVPEGAENYQLVLLDYYEAMIDGIRAGAAGDQAELNRLIEEVLSGPSGKSSYDTG